MKTLPANAAGSRLADLLDEVARDHEPVQILGDGVNGVLVSEDDWRSVQETLHLLSTPGMRDSIRTGLATPLEECDHDPGW